MPTFEMEESDVPRLWDIQAKSCPVSPPGYQKDVDTTRQQFYYTFGMTVWQIYPKAAWVLSEDHDKLDVTEK